MKKKFFALVISYLGFCIAIADAVAQQQYYESEPNNAPHEAEQLTSPVSILGALPGGDQDGFNWTISDDDAHKRWSLTLEGIPEAITTLDIIELEYAANGTDISARKNLLSLTSRDGSRPVRIDNLLFNPGDYLLGLSRAGGNKPAFSIQLDELELDDPASQKLAGQNIETSDAYRINIEQSEELRGIRPTGNNDKPEKAKNLRINAEFVAYQEHEEGWYQIKLDAKQAQQRWTLNGQVPVGISATLALLDESGKTLTQTSADKTGQFALPDLGLAAGVYRLKLTLAKTQGSLFTLSLLETGQRTEGDEAEPNDKFQQANIIDFSEPLNGHISTKKDKDFYRFSIDEKQTERLWQLSLNSRENLSLQLCLLDKQGKPLQCRTGKQDISLPDLHLNADIYGVSVSRAQAATDYTLELSAKGKHKAIFESEPNERISEASAFSRKNLIKGRLHGEDIDVFRINVDQEPQLWRFQAVGEGISAITYFDSGGKKAAELKVKKGQRRARLSNIFLLPGVHYVAVSGTDGKYVLRALPIGPPNPDMEREPNDHTSSSHQLKIGQTRSGLLADPGDNDYYQFSAHGDDQLTVKFIPPNDGAAKLWLFWDGHQIQRYLNTKAGEPIEIAGHWPPGDYQLKLETGIANEQEYQLSLQRSDTYQAHISDAASADIQIPFQLNQDQSDALSPSLSLSITTDSKTLAAYSDRAQRFDGVLTINNNDENNAMTLDLRAASSDYRWRIELPQQPLNIAAGADIELPFTVVIAPDVSAGTPVRLGVHAFVDNKIQNSAYIDVDANTDVVAVNPHTYWSMPEQLLGGFNVAWSAFEAKTIAEGGRDLELLNDAMAIIGRGFILPPKQRDFMPTFQLAVDQPVPVAGVALHPLGKQNAPETLQQFEILTSSDGTTYQKVLSAELKPIPVEQVFVFERPVSAQYIRLKLKSNHIGTTNSPIGLGEFKAIAAPGFVPKTDFNLAQPELGGHVVWADPPIERNWDQNIITAESKKPPRPGTRSAAEWVIGFHHQRAAQIERLEWENLSLKSRNWHYFPYVDVAVSLQSPNGPWQPLGRWQLNETDKTTSEWRLPESVWARYVKFSTDAPEQRNHYQQYPNVVRIFERSGDKNYFSILAEWGHYARPAIYEYLHPEPISPQLSVLQQEGGQSKDNAQTLSFAEPVSGIVQRGKRSDWYRVEIPPQQNTLELVLQGNPTIGVIAELQDSDGNMIAVREIEHQPDRLQIQAEVIAGAVYWIKISQPQSSVIFSWDTSASVNPYIPIIYNALSGFAEDITPNEEQVNLLPFGGKLLSQRWLDQSYPLQGILNNYNRSDDSSAAESALLQASQELLLRSGTKAVVLLTDAATARNNELWPILSQVKPRVFALGLSSANAFGSRPTVEQDLMQTWAAVNNGAYDYLKTQGELEQAFARIALRLRQAAAYTLTVNTLLGAPAEPGSVRVLSSTAENDDDQNMPSDVAIELILDASGSMLKRLNGKRRINIAKEALIDLLTNNLADGTPIALRVFGHKQAGACRTDLEQSLAPLNKKRVIEKIKKINAKNLAKTPIADSLNKAVKDLAKAQHSRIIVLLTDGEETCDGDPAAAIQALRETGFDVRVNIIGFAIDDAALRQQFDTWAKIGNGRYFDASNAEALGTALSQASQISYQVFDDNNQEVATGYLDGAAVSLPVGRYRVEWIKQNQTHSEQISISSGKETVIHSQYLRQK